MSGLNHLTANEAHRKVPRVQISHSPPTMEEVFHGGTLVLKTSQCQRSWHKRVRLLSLPPSASAAVKVWHRSVKPGSPEPVGSIPTACTNGPMI